MTNKDLVRKLRKGPDLDKYLEGKKKKYHVKWCVGSGYCQAD